ncbi:MAG: TonB family protein / TonB-dependent receptor [Labilithrix sp.]|nr:TonB family protein / TonB-dependent receptor [Labilithrix sp.]
MLVCALPSVVAAQPLPTPPPSGPTAPTGVAVEPPKLLSDPEVPYPEGAKGDATVILVLIVGEDGAVRSASPEGADEPFLGAAAEAARAWRFDPATRGGRPLAARIKIAITFRAPVVMAAAVEPDPEPTPRARPSAPAPKHAPPERPDEVRVRGAREPSRTVSLSRTEVRQIPGAFGDPFRAVEIMPGVTPIVSGLPFFFVRGAPPGNVGYYLDGVRIPLLFHVGAGPSVVHPGLIQRVDLYPGGYPARFGRFSGGIVAGETAPPLDRPHGEYNVRLFDAGAMIETPFGPKNRGSVLVGGRYSYTAFLLTQIASDTLLDYWDYQARATYDLTPDDRIGVFAFGSYDYLGQRTPTQDITLFGTEFHRVDLRYDRKLGDKGGVRIAVTTGFDRSRAQEDRFVRDRVLGARTEWTYYAHPRVLLRAGSDMQVDSYDVQVVSGTLAPSVARVANYFPSRTDLAFGTRADAVIAVARGLEVTPGARVDLFASQGATAVGVDPRLAMRTEVTSKVRVLSALGIAHQPPSFVVPVPGFQPGGLRGGLQKAYQEGLGIEADIFESVTATATVFHNAFFDMSDPLGTSPPQLSGCPPGTFPSDTLAGDRGRIGTGFAGTCGVPRFPPGTIGPDRSGGGQQGADSRGTQTAANAFEVRTRGEAIGLELFVKKKLTSRIGGFLSYTLSRSTRTYGGRDYIATFDRTHVLNTALAFDLGKNWRAGTRFTFYTGLPKAPDPTSDSTRLDPFYRVDLRLEKRWQLKGTWWISAVAEWLNATLSKEAVATTCTLRGCEAQLIGPVTIPSVGVEGGF